MDRRTRTCVEIGLYLAMDRHQKARLQSCPSFLNIVPPSMEVTCCTMSPAHQISRWFPFAWPAMPSFMCMDMSLLSRLLLPVEPQPRLPLLLWRVALSWCVWIRHLTVDDPCSSVHKCANPYTSWSPKVQCFSFSSTKTPGALAKSFAF